MLDEKTPSFVRADLARALAVLEGDTAMIVRKLLGILERKTDSATQKRDRRYFIESLGLLGPKAKTAVPTLRKFVDDDDDSVGEAAVWALEQIESK
jgi:HEAT repeat protein